MHEACRCSHVDFAFGDLAERLGKIGDEITVSRELVTRLLDLYISCWDFDEDWYLATYSDVREAVEPRQVFVGLGAFQIDWVSGGAFGELAALSMPNGM